MSWTPLVSHVSLSSTQLLRLSRIGLLPALKFILFAISCFHLPPVQSWGEEADPAVAPPQRKGALVRVSLPFPGDDANTTIKRIDSAIASLKSANGGDARMVPVLVLELVAVEPSKFGEGCKYDNAHNVAKHLLDSVDGVKTIAYLPHTLRGHGVLIALACDEIAMHRDAEIGDAGIDEPKRATFNPLVRSMYENVISMRGTVPKALGLGMVDPTMTVLKVQTERDTQYIEQKDLNELKKKVTLLKEPEQISAAGSFVHLNTDEARLLGVARHSVTDTDDLASALQVPLDALKETEFAQGAQDPIAVKIDGLIENKTFRRVESLISGARASNHSNWVAVEINSRGGDLEAAKSIAEFLAKQSNDEMRTIAYVPKEAAGGAALIALSCDKLVMGPNAKLGGRPDLIMSEEEFMANLPTYKESIKDSLAPATGKNWSVLMAFLDPNLDVYPFRNKETGRIKYLSVEEAKAVPYGPDWIKQDNPITEVNKTLELSTDRAKELGLAWQTASSLKEVGEISGIEEPIREVKLNWALELVEALASPGFAALLLVIGFTAMYAELHMPGMGLGGFVATIAFLLFFWSNYLDGNADWLEALLFVFGLVFLLVEVFVIPGFGIFGLGGGLMILVSLVLASQNFILPHGPTQMAELRSSLTVVASACIGVVVCGMFLRNLLPHTPLFNRIMLSPPDASQQEWINKRESVADFDHLLGQIGVASTHLRPTGKALFDGELVDVIAEGTAIDQGTKLEVVHVQGNRILVVAANSRSV